MAVVLKEAQTFKSSSNCRSPKYIAVWKAAQLLTDIPKEQHNRALEAFGEQRLSQWVQMFVRIIGG